MAKCNQLTSLHFKGLTVITLHASEEVLCFWYSTSVHVYACVSMHN